MKIRLIIENAETPFFYYHDAPLSTDPLVMDAYRERCYDRVNMTSTELVDRLEHPEMQYAYSYAAKIDVLSLQGIYEALPLTPFMVLPPNYNPIHENEHRQTHIWLSSANSSTPGSILEGTLSMISEYFMINFGA